MPVQTVVDSSYRFIFAYMLFCGSTHDSVAFSFSSLATAISAGRLPNGFWSAEDAAYIGSNSLSVPYTSSQLTNEEEGIWWYAFIFFQSSFRIHVAQASGMPGRRFGVL